MSDAWKRLDLGGGGLQQANLRLAARLRRRDRAWLAYVLFPLGLHRDYLGDRRGAWLLRGLAALALAALAFSPTAALGIALALAALAVLDALRMESRIAAANKRLRMEAFLRTDTAGAPEGFRGHYTDGPGDGTAPGPGRHAPSFAEQARQLAELARRRRDGA